MAGRQYAKVAYGLSDSLLNVFPAPILANRAPATTDKAQIGQVWVYVANNAAYILTSIVSNSATWQLIEASGGVGNFSSLTVNPGPINLTGVLTQVGTANINVTGTANTNINSSTNTGTVTIGSANATAVSLLAPLMGVDSTAGGAIGIGASVTSGTINIGHALTTGAMVIGDALTTGSIILGAAGVGAATSSVTVKGDSLSLDSKAAGSIVAGSSLTTGTLTLGAAAMTGALTLGLSTAGQTIAVGNGVNAGAQVVNIASGASAADSTVSILGGVATAGVSTLNLATGTLAAGKIVHIADGASPNAVTIGSVTGAASTIVQGGTGEIYLRAAGQVKADLATDIQASPSATAVINARMGYATFTGFTTASTASQVFTITNSKVALASAILVSANNLGANDAKMTVTRVVPGVGTMDITLTNNGSAALNGDVNITFWVMD